MTTPKNNWQVYLLVSERGRTYVGCTTDIYRRLDQHNKKKPGGARATSKESGWKIVSYISGFKNRSESMRWESLVKKRARGLSQRSEAMWMISEGLCPAPRKYGKMYIPPTKLTLYVGVQI